MYTESQRKHLSMSHYIKNMFEGQMHFFIWVPKNENAVLGRNLSVAVCVLTYIYIGRTPSLFGHRNGRFLVHSGNIPLEFCHYSLFLIISVNPYSLFLRQFIPYSLFFEPFIPYSLYFEPFIPYSLTPKPPPFIHNDLFRLFLHSIM